jgi:hypothetical protein
MLDFKNEQTEIKLEIKISNRGTEYLRLAYESYNSAFYDNDSVLVRRGYEIRLQLRRLIV